MWKGLKELFSLFFEKVNPEAPPVPRAPMVHLVTFENRTKLDMVQESLRSYGVDFEVRKGKEIFVPENELESAKAIIAEGNWEY
jgi:hypothetical protein